MRLSKWNLYFRVKFLKFLNVFEYQSKDNVHVHRQGNVQNERSTVFLY